MASSYQYELRERVISAVESGMAVVKVKEIFKVGRATIVLPKVNDNCIMTILGNEGNGIQCRFAGKSSIFG